MAVGGCAEGGVLPTERALPPRQELGGLPFLHTRGKATYRQVRAGTSLSPPPLRFREQLPEQPPRGDHP